MDGQRQDESLEALITALKSWLSGRPEILLAVLYGSAAEGSRFRDVDVAVYLDRTAAPASQDLDYEQSLVEESRQVVPYPVDVRVINQAPLAFRYNVTRGVSLVERDAGFLARFREATWDEYFDFQPVALRYLKDMA